jgi:hypothetical protein
LRRIFRQNEWFGEKKPVAGFYAKDYPRESEGCLLKYTTWSAMLTPAMKPAKKKTNSKRKGREQKKEKERANSTKQRRR